MTVSNPPAGATGRAPDRRGFRGRLRDARIRVKLGVILIIPVLAVLALATDRIVSHAQQARGIDQIRSLAELGAQASAVIQQVQHERMAAAAFLADAGAASDAYLPQIRRTDQAIAAYTALRSGLGNVPATVADRLRSIDQQVGTLESTRQQVLTRSDLTVSAVVLRYGAMAEDLVAFRESVGQIAGDTPLGDPLRAAAALSRTKVEVGEEQAVAYVALRTGTVDNEELTSFLGTLIAQQESLQSFMLAATPEQRSFVSDTLTGDAISLADAVSNDVVRSAGRPALVGPDEAAKALGAVVDLIRWAEERVDRDVVAAATSQRNTVIWQVIAETTAVLLVLLVALAIALMLARTLVRSLRALRVGALRVADRDLPATVARLSDRHTLGDHTPAQIAAEMVVPIGLSSSDEIGEVARAFNVVHREAVRVAAEQASLHTSVSVMFSNLARRSQSLVDQMIAHLDEMERSEEDAKRLSRLFRLDHLATRMRRNDENLLILSGSDTSPPRREDSLVADVLRAAQAEIQHYDRVEFGPVDLDAVVRSTAVNDVVRLLAELIDNATRFSPTEAAVLVSARLYQDSVLIQIEDRGVGMTPQQVVYLNTRLSEPPTMDGSTFRMMGLAVVGRLADRYHIRIELHGAPGKGTTVYVRLPGSIVQLGRASVAAGTLRQQVPAGPPPRWSDPTPGGGLFVGPAPRYPVRTGGSTASATHPPWTDTVVMASPMSPVAPPVDRWASSAADTAEMPIYQEMEASWFGTGSLRGDPTWSNPLAGEAVPPAPRSHDHTPPPRTRGWHTVADDGWRAARTVDESQVRTQTRNGLPKRVPQAQLVPGGVDDGAPAAAQRSPDGVRGLLSAYHRGVQRGRGLGDAPATG